LTPIQLAAERIHRHAAAMDSELQAVVTSGCEAIVAQVSGLKELVDAFQQFARLPTISPRPSDVGQLLREIASLYDGVREGLTVAVAAPEHTVVAVVDPVQLRQALVNLLDNAVAAVGDHGTIALRLAVAEGDVVIDVEDDGSGLPTEDTETLVDPFYSTKGRGSGMGLAMVHRIVIDHGGELDLVSREPRGTRVRIVLHQALTSSPAQALHRSE
jgi:nitrogen fixation/metabolism regulation signal transduction histidine kinase